VPLGNRTGALIDPALAERLERNLGRVLLATRWLMAPIYVGLLASVVLLAIKFVQKFFLGLHTLLSDSATEEMLGVLQLVDIALVANLVLTVVFAGWESVIGPLLAGTRSGFSGIGFGGVKLRLIASIAAIAAIQILETFMHFDQTMVAQALWQLAILLGIGVLGVLLALMDKLAGDH
jgi:uncharacterized protein (TIGR00645 family)